MNNTIHITGHKNPDTDAICSAMSYAHLKQLMGEDNVLACRLGPVNDETKFALKTFGLDNPMLISDARSQLKDIDMDPPLIIDETVSVFQAWNLTYKNANRSLFVKSSEKGLAGLISTSNLAALRMKTDRQLAQLMKHATLKAIAQTIDGVIVNPVDDFTTSGEVYIVTMVDTKAYKGSFKDSICVLSDDFSEQKHLIKAGVKCLVITCGNYVPDDVVEMAREYNCAVVKTEQDTMRVARVINEAFPASLIMTENPVVCGDEEYVDEAMKKITSTGYRCYPVMTADGEILGSLSRYHLIDYKPKKFILTDHSSTMQSVTNIEKAEIVEIIDHHNIGNVQTALPIYYRNQKCGCTCSIVYQMYKEAGIRPEREYAGIMLSAIISDTLNFKSRTTTQFDIDNAKELAEIAGVDLYEYAVDLLGASVAIKDSTPDQILNRDLKEYEFNGYKIAVAQTNYSRIEEVQKILPSFKRHIEKVQADKGLDLIVMLFTHVLAEGSLFVYSGRLSGVVGGMIDTVFDDNSGYDHQMISRKQQVVPALSNALNKL